MTQGERADTPNLPVKGATMTAAWRKLFPSPIRQLLNAVWPERWTQTELDAIRREAQAEWRKLGGDA